MNKKILIVILLGALLIGISLAVVAQQFVIPQDASISSALSISIEGQNWSNGQTLSWGQVSPGMSYSKTMNVTNIGTQAFTIIITLNLLPTNWSLSWVQNASIVSVGNSLLGPLTLTVPTNAADGQYQWTMSITANI